MAEIKVTHPLGERRNRYFQNSAGSTRFESTSPDGKETAVTIHNYQQKMSYARNPAGEWASLPLKVAGEHRPRRMPRDTVGLTEVGEKTILGFKVYRYVSAGGVTKLLAPDLNLFPLLMESPKGLREEVIVVVRGEPAPELFVPPAGANVRRASNTNDLLSVKRPPR